MNKIMNYIYKFQMKYKEMPLPAKASFWYMICSVMQRGLSFIITPFFTRIMTLDEYGKVSLFFSWMVFITIIATLAIPTGGFSKAMSKYSDDRSGYTSSALILSSITTVICLALYFVISYFTSDFLGLERNLVFLMFVDIFFTTPLMLWTIKNRFEYKYRSVVYVTLFTSFLTVIANVVSVLIFSNNRAVARIESTVIIHVAIYSFIFVYLLINGKNFINREYWSYSVRYNLPLVPHYLSQQVLIQSDRVMLEKLCNMADVALYSLAYTFAILMQIFVDAIHASFVPWAYQNFDKKTNQNISKRAIQLEIFVGGLCLLITLIAPEIIMVLGGEKYIAAVYIIPPVSMSILFILLYSMFGTVGFYYEKTSYVMIASVIAAITNIVMNLICIPIWGFIAAGYTTLFSYVLYSGIHFMVMKKIIRDNSVECPYNGLKMWLIATAFVITAFLVSAFYSHILIRYVVLVVSLVVVVVLVKRIKSDDSSLLW